MIPKLNDIEITATKLKLFIPYLWEHRDQWPEELSIPSKLSALILQHRSLHITLTELSSEHQIRKVTSTIDALGYSCDTTILPLLKPLLDDKTEIIDPSMGAMAEIRSPTLPSRMCDKALESFLRILGIDPRQAYSKAIKESDFPELVTNDSLSRVLRDLMIDNLKNQMLRMAQ